MALRDPVTVDIVPPDNLPPSDIVAWALIQARVEAFANPLFGPHFSLAVGKVRPDVRVAVYRRGAEPVGFLAFHERPGGLARPVGASFSDYHGIVSNGHIGVSGRDALALAGLRAFRVNGLVDPFGHFAGEISQTAPAFVLKVEGDPAGFLETLRAGNPKRFKNYRRLESKLEREVGPLRFVANDTDTRAFEAAMSWKREQFRRSGLQDVLRPDWVRALMSHLFETRQGLMTGKLASLYAGDVLLSAQFGVRQGRVFHPWIASSNPDFADYSPGQMFLLQAIRSMAADGLSAYDLSTGHDHYKRPFGPQVRKVGLGLLTVAPARARRPAPASAVSKVGRLDHIAAVDPTLAGRLVGLAEAALAARRRGFGNHSANEGVA